MNSPLRSEPRPAIPGRLVISKRENDVLRLIHLPDKLIAHRLHISTETVANHLTNVRRRNGLASKIELAIVAAKLKLI
jgi:DNA-binding NarL/FixJ family response regulator